MTQAETRMYWLRILHWPGRHRQSPPWVVIEGRAMPGTVEPHDGAYRHGECRTHRWHHPQGPSSKRKGDRQGTAMV